jgi:hypothetical protein
MSTPREHVADAQVEAIAGGPMEITFTDDQLRKIIDAPADPMVDLIFGEDDEDQTERPGEGG